MKYESDSANGGGHSDPPSCRSGSDSSLPPLPQLAGRRVILLFHVVAPLVVPELGAVFEHHGGIGSQADCLVVLAKGLVVAIEIIEGDGARAMGIGQVKAGQASHRQNFVDQRKRLAVEIVVVGEAP